MVENLNQSGDLPAGAAAAEIEEIKAAVSIPVDFNSSASWVGGSPDQLIARSLKDCLVDAHTPTTNELL